MRTNRINWFKKMLWMSIVIPILMSLSLFATDPVRIMPLGDSITDGTDAAHTTAAEKIAYRGSLWTKLSSGGYSVDFVGSQASGSDYHSTDPTFDIEHEGYTSETADKIASEVHGYLSTNHADIVLLHIGTNDLTPDGDNTDQTVTYVEQILINIDIYSTDTKVILALIIDRKSSDPETISFNAKLKTMAQTRIDNGDDIIIVDMEHDAGIGAADMYDELHPNDTGYAKMADLWYSALQSAIPMHLWKLEEATGLTTYLDTYREANGTCIGAGCPVAVIGKIGNAQKFSGTNEINVTDTTTFDWSADANITIEFWMKSDQPPSGENAVMIGRKGELDSGSDVWFVGMEYDTVTEEDSGKITCGLGNRNGDLQYTVGTINVADGQWTHIAYVVTGDDLKVYVNAVLDINVTRTSPNTEHIQGTPVNIGYLNWGSGFEYTGLLDEIAIFDSALSEAQILKHAQVGQSPALTITSNPVTLAEVNVPYLYDVNSNNDPIDGFVLNPPTPDWLTINDPTLGVITGTPGTDTVGNFAVEVEAIDGAETDTQNYVLKVRNTSNLPSDMNHYWKLDETASSPYIDAYSGADGTCIGAGCPVAVIGKIGNAQKFSGTNEINVTDTTTFDWSADANITIEFWMKSDQPPSGENAVMIGRKGELDSGSDVWFVGMEYDTVTEEDSGKITCGLGNRNGDLQYTVGTINVADGQWTHIAYVVTGDDLKVYVNAVLDINVTRTSPNTEHIQGTPVNIGYLNWGSGFEYTGLLDEMVVFNSALTQTEIQKHFNDGNASNEFGAPTLTEVTPIATPTNDSTPEYTFHSDQAGTITYGGFCTSTATTEAVAGNNTITFDALAEGTYNNCTITVTDYADNASPALSVTAFVVDTTAAILTEVTPVPTPSNDTTPEYTFNTNKEGTITYGGSCGSATPTDATVGDNTITYGTLAAGTYSDCTITVTDAAGNTSPALSVSTFVIDTTAPNAPTEVTPVPTPSNDTTPEYTFNTNKEGTITYGGSCGSATPTDATVGDNTITYGTLAAGTYSDCTITVTDAAGNTSPALSVSTFVIDTTAPIITLNGDNPMDVLQGSTFTDPGATATDDVDDTVAVVENGTVDTSTVGSYTRTYTATDAAGNVATETRTVNVIASSWFTFEDDGSTVKFTTADGSSTVELGSDLFDIKANDDMITFKGKSQSNIGGCLINAHIIMKSNGDVIAGYTHEGNGCTNDINGFAPGTTVRVGNDPFILIDAPLTEDIIFGGQ